MEAISVGTTNAHTNNQRTDAMIEVQESEVYKHAFSTTKPQMFFAMSNRRVYQYHYIYPGGCLVVRNSISMRHSRSRMVQKRPWIPQIFRKYSHFVL